MFRCSVECAHTPARQSACSSMRTDRALPALGFRRCACRHLGFHAEDLLHVMADLMGNHVGLRKIRRVRQSGATIPRRTRGRYTPSRRPDSRTARWRSPPCRTPTGSRRGTAPAWPAGTAHRPPATAWSRLPGHRREQTKPVALIAARSDWPRVRARRSVEPARPVRRENSGKQVGFEDEAQYRQDQHSADAEVHAAKAAKRRTAAAIVVAAILDVVTHSSGRPAHRISSVSPF